MLLLILNIVGESMLDVLIYLFENYVINGDSFEPGQDELAKELVGAGFEGAEVDRAFEWLDGLIGINGDCLENDQWQSSSPSSIRFYTKDETLRLKPEGLALLMRLTNVGVLSECTREAVIERVLALESSDVSINNIKWVVLMVLSNHPGFSDIAEWAEGIVDNDLQAIIH